MPEGWVWTSLGEIFLHNTGKALNASDRKGKLLSYITTSKLYWDRFELSSIKEMYFTEEKIEKCTVKKGDLLVCEGGDIGRAAIWNQEYDIRIQNHIHRLRGFGGINQRLFLFWLMFMKNEGMIGGKGIGLMGLSSRELDKMMMPLPPINEEKSIVDIIDILFNAIDALDYGKESLSEQVSAAKAKILDLAIQGKLVPQDPFDEPALELLKRINSSFQPSHNLHYGDCPEGWTIATVADVFEINPKVQGFDEVDAGFVPMTNICDGFRNKFNFEVRKWAKIKNGFTRFANGDIAVAKISPCLENRKSAIMRNLPNGIGAGTTELNIFRSRAVNPEYGLLYFKSDDFINACTGSYNGVVGQQRVSRSLIEGMQFLLPPMEEQKRIVAAINGYFAVINDIESSLQ